MKVVIPLYPTISTSFLLFPLEQLCKISVFMGAAWCLLFSSSLPSPLSLALFPSSPLSLLLPPHAFFNFSSLTFTATPFQCPPNHEGTQFPEGTTYYNRIIFTMGPASQAAADVIFVVDESGSMVMEHIGEVGGARVWRSSNLIGLFCLQAICCSTAIGSLPIL